MTVFFKPQVTPEHFTNINNTNYTKNLTTTNDTNDINYTLCETKTSETDVTPAGASGLASLPASQPGEVICSGVGNPPEILPILWKGLKIDLFDNGVKGSGKRSLKLKFGVIKKDGTTQSLVALMNSPVNYVWRQVEDVDRYNPHWTTVRNIQERFDSNNIPYRASKCTLPSKGGSTEAVTFLSEDNKDWFIIIVREGQQFNFIISKESPVTSAQRAGNIIASKFIGQQMRPLITFKELGI